MPPEPASFSIDPIDVVDTANSPHSLLQHGIPEQPPEPLSLVVDLAEVEDGVDLNESIPEIPPEPVSLSLELVEVDETPRSTTGRRDTLSHTDLEIPPEPLSIVIDLTESDDVLETWNGALAEVPPDPVSFSINLVDAPMGSQSFVMRCSLARKPRLLTGCGCFDRAPPDAVFSSVYRLESTQRGPR